MFTLHNGDCLQYMRSMQDKSVDLILTDPPYGIGINQNSKPVGIASNLSRMANDKTWDDNIPSAEYFKEMFRVSKNQIVFGANYFWESFYSSPCYIIWDKRGNLPKVPFCDTEFAWTSFDKMSKKYTVINHGFIKDSNDEKTIHPTQKPSELFVNILRDFAKDGQVIFDPFMGSGTAGVACERLGLPFIGCEISTEYFQIAERRIQSAALQPSLFTPSNNRLHLTGGGLPATQSSFTAEIIPPAKLPAKSPRR